MREFIERNPTLLTNFPKHQKVRYEAAIQIFKEKTGKDVLYIREDAYGMFGQEVYDSYSLHKTEDGDKSDFWDIFDNLKETWTLKTTQP